MSEESDLSIRMEEINQELENSTMNLIHQENNETQDHNLEEPYAQSDALQLKITTQSSGFHGHKPQKSYKSAIAPQEDIYGNEYVLENVMYQAEPESDDQRVDLSHDVML